MFSWRRFRPERGGVTNRSRYDTQALVTEIKKERRHALVLGAVGVAIAILLVILYFSISGGSDEPSTPAGQAAAVAREGPKPTTFGAGVKPPTTPPGEVPPGGSGATTPDSPSSGATATDKPATIKTMLTKKTTLWIDGKPVVHGKDIAIPLAAGAHEVKLKLGKKVATQKVDFKGGGEYELRFDPKNEKAQLKKVK